MKRESVLTRELVKSLRGWGLFYKVSDRFNAGLPDIVGCLKGKFIAIEVKRKDRLVTSLQKFKLLEILENNGLAFIVTFREEDVIEVDFLAGSPMRTFMSIPDVTKYIISQGL
jgi:Holliday junction resolvase